MRALGARFPVVLLTGAVDTLSYEDRVLFARCIEKGGSVQNLLGTLDLLFSKDLVHLLDLRSPTVSQIEQEVDTSLVKSEQ